ncbi:MAG: NADH-quinone oxidoreductase subunit H [Synergistaceae bacterium]|nr:NADH-quinone oxidoreductase subunit H [Synergistaceae bacterium]
MTDILTRLLSGTALLFLVLLLAILYDGVDRVVHARMQRRLGPPILQPFYDVMKLFVKENIVPRRAVAWVFNGAPLLAVTAVLMVFLYVPMGSLPPILGTGGDLILIVYLFALSAVAMVAGGFASGSPYANIGAQREMVLMMSYEVPLAIVVTTLAYFAYRSGIPGEPFNLATFVAMPVWGVAGWMGVLGLAALFVSLMAVVPAEVGKVPMDIAEAKTEILEGLICEYSGRNLAMFKLTFALRNSAMCAVVVSLFLPWNIGSSLGLTGAWLLVADFLFFWLKVLLLQVFGVTLIRTAFGRFKIWQASQFYWVQVGGLALAGMILLSLDLLA